MLPFPVGGTSACDLECWVLCGLCPPLQVWHTAAAACPPSQSAGLALCVLWPLAHVLARISISSLHSGATVCLFVDLVDTWCIFSFWVPLLFCLGCGVHRWLFESVVAMNGYRKCALFYLPQCSWYMEFYEDFGKVCMCACSSFRSDLDAFCFYQVFLLLISVSYCALVAQSAFRNSSSFCTWPIVLQIGICLGRLNI